MRGFRSFEFIDLFKEFVKAAEQPVRKRLNDKNFTVPVTRSAPRGTRRAVFL
jgi:hypothetical protein